MLRTPEFSVGAWTVKPAECVITTENDVDGVIEHSLDPRQIEVLIYLAKRQGSIISIDELIKEIWPTSSVSKNAVSQAITKIRNALRDKKSSPEYIATYSKRGYSLIAKVEFFNNQSQPDLLSSKISILQMLKGRSKNLETIRWFTVTMSLTTIVLFIILIYDLATGHQDIAEHEQKIEMPAKDKENSQKVESPQ